MSKTVHSVKLIPYDSVELDTVSYSNGDLVYDNTNSTIRLMNGVIQGGTNIATQPWIENLLTTINNTINFTNTTQSTNSSTGAVTLAGGLGVALNTNIGGTLGVTGASHLYSTLEVDNDFSVNTNKFTVDHTTGNTYSAGTLRVVGATTLNSTLEVDNDFTVNTNKFTIDHSTGNTYSAGTLRVVGATTFNNTLEVDNDFSINTNKFTVDHTTGNTSIAGTLQVTNGVTAYNGLTLSGSSTPATEYFTVNNGNSTNTFQIDSATGNTFTTGTLQVGNDFSINTNKFTVDHTTGNTSIAGTLQVNSTLSTTSPNITTSITSPSATFNLVNTTPTTVNFAGNATTINIGASTGTTAVKNNLTVSGTAKVTGYTEVDGNFQVGTTAGGNAFTVNGTTGNVVIQGSLTTYGTNYQIGSVSSISGPLTTVHSGTFSSNDGNDIGVLFNYYDTQQRNGFFGYQNSTQSFVYYTAATNTGGVFSGTLGNAIFGNVTANNIIASATTANIANTTATTVNAFQAATNINVGAVNGTFTFYGNVITGGNTYALNLNGPNPSISTTSTGTASVFNTNATTINAFGAASTINFGTGNTVTANIGSVSTPTSTSTLALNGSTVYITTPGNPAQMYIAQAASGQIYLGGPGATLYLGTGTGNNTLNILGNAIGGTATLTSNVTVGTVNNWASVTSGTINFGVNCTNVINIGGSGSTVTFGGSIVESSSIALKQNVQPITGALALVNQLQGVTYDRKNGSSYNEAGLIAEAVNQIIPNLVKKNDNGDPEGINYTKLTAYLIEAVKELTARVDQLTKK